MAFYDGNGLTSFVDLQFMTNVPSLLEHVEIRFCFEQMSELKKGMKMEEVK